MAKKKKKDGIRIPKEIGGMKVPKELRQKGDALIAKANTPEGRELIASGLAMAAAAAAAAAARRRPVTPAPPATPRTPGEGGTTDPRDIGDALGNAAEAMMTRLFGARRPG